MRRAAAGAPSVAGGCGRNEEEEGSGCCSEAAAKASAAAAGRRLQSRKEGVAKCSGASNGVIAADTRGEAAMSSQACVHRKKVERSSQSKRAGSNVAPLFHRAQCSHHW